jgi:RNA polymerase sigma-70 factor (sigma-E family)
MIGEDPAAGAAQSGAAAGPRRRSGPAVPARQPAPPPAAKAAGDLVEVLFRAHALTLIRTALLLVGDQSSAEDVVQEAFLGLFRSMPRLRDPEKALPYLRASVLNGCRSVVRARGRARLRRAPYDPPVWSAESAALCQEERRAVLAATARLPRRQREVLALRYYLDLTDQEIAEVLRVSRGTVSSTASRALAALARDLREEP